jgi:hypothetical protein
LRYRGQSITHWSACALPLSTPLLPSPEGDTFLPVCVSHRKTAKRFMQHIKPRGVQCRAIVPNGSTRRAAEASYGCLVLARRATLLCRYASANRGYFLKPPTKVRLTNQRGLTFDLSRIGCSAPRASCLAPRLSELRAFAVSLARFPQRILDQSSCFFQQRIDDCRVMNVDF